MALTQRQKKIFKALNALARRVATAREIATITHENVNGVMQTLNHLSGKSFSLEGKQYELCNRIKTDSQGGDPDVILWYLVEK